MKTQRLLLSAIAAFAVVSLSVAADPVAKNEPLTEVTFQNPDKFADVREDYMGSEKGRDGILEQLKDYIVQQTKSYVPAGQKLLITVTGVDMAGDFEPWRGPQMTDVRVVKDVYPPKVDLTFKLTGPDGKVVKEGKRQLRDLAFMTRISINTSDNLRFEKALLDDWIRAEFKRVKNN